MSDKGSNPAFPVHPEVSGNDQLGMSFRDYVAVMAMQSCIGQSGSYERVARDAYAFADALLAERDKPRNMTHPDDQKV